MYHKGTTYKQINHLLEWGVSGQTEWLQIGSQQLANNQKITFSFHLQNHHRMDTFVKTVLFWRMWLRGAQRPRSVGVCSSRRWSTVTATKVKPPRWAEYIVLNGLTVNGGTKTLINLVRPKKFDYTRWRITMRSQVVAQTRWNLYLIVGSALMHDDYRP